MITVAKSCFAEPEIHTKVRKIPGGKKKLITKRMLSKPEWGWTDFQLPGGRIYQLSYYPFMIPIKWLKEAVCGLKRNKPFTVEAFMEPYSMICTVSEKQCSIKVVDKDDEENKTEDGYLIEKLKNYQVSMLQFCTNLYQDIANDIDAWSEFDWSLNENPDYKDEDDKKIANNKKEIKKLLKELQEFLERKTVN